MELPETTPIFKEGFMMRKNEMEGPHKKVPRGKRYWRPYYVHLRGFLLYFVPVRLNVHVYCTYNKYMYILPGCFDCELRVFKNLQLSELV